MKFRKTTKQTKKRTTIRATMQTALAVTLVAGIMADGNITWGGNNVVPNAFAAYLLTVNAAENGQNQSVITPESITDSATNIEHQNYRLGSWYFAWNAACPVQSYLTVTKEGKLMRFEPDSSGGYIATYYTDNGGSYQFVDSVSIPAELTLFGGFYAGEDGYYVITGQENPEESAEVECIRITKYDKSWKRVSSAGLYDCNTVEPFDFGSLRVAEYGDYLVIRSSHKMYQSSDGLNHQSNITIQYSKSQSKITDSYYQVMNKSFGYVSHSFNQFVKIEDGKMVAVDHGDAYPRSIVLIQYPTDISSGSFVPQGWNNLCTATDVMTFGGNTGANYTGASVGGFEYSGTSYLIAGAAEENVGTGTSNNNSERNVFLSVVSKEDNSVQTKYLTDFTGKGMTANTPQLVKVNDNKFLLLWTERSLSNGRISYEGEVHYAAFDGQGKQISDEKTAPGYLSDCQPIIKDGQVLWYVWSNKRTVFYSINPDTMELKESLLRQKGDTNGDGTVDIADALIVSRFDARLVELSDAEKAVSDVNGDGEVDVADALVISRFDAGIIDKIAQ